MNFVKRVAPALLLIATHVSVNQFRPWRRLTCDLSSGGSMSIYAQAMSPRPTTMELCQVEEDGYQCCAVEVLP